MQFDGLYGEDHLISLWEVDMLDLQLEWIVVLMLNILGLLK